METHVRNHLFYLSALTLLLFFTGLGARDFWAPVEPRYAEIARIMFAKGEWIVPTVNGDLYTDKPILYFWLVLIASKIAGAVNEWTVRLPAALGGIGFVLTTYLIGRDFYNPRVGLVAAAVLATSVRVIWEARWAHIDMVFGLFFLLTIFFGARSLLHKGSKNEVLLAYVFMALAVLSKGLIGVVLPALVLTVFIIVRRDWRVLIEARLALGVPIFLLIAAPWFYWVSSVTDGKWLADFIYVHHIQRYTDGNGHRKSFYYYLTTLPVDFMPWTTFAIPAVFAYFPYRQIRQQAHSLFFFLCFAVVFLFFSISDTKRDLYLLPLLPSLALFLGNYVDDLTEGRLPRSTLYRWLGQLFFGAAAIAGLALPVVLWFTRPEIFWLSLPAAMVLTMGAILTVLFIRRHQPLKAVASAALLMTSVMLCVSLSILPYVDRLKSPRPFSLQIKKLVPPAAPLYIYADTMNDFNYYTERESIPVLSSSGEVAQASRQHGEGYLLIKERDLAKIGVLDREQIVTTGTVGSTIWYLVSLNELSETLSVPWES